MNIANGDPYFIGLPGIKDSIQHTMGIRFDWFAYSALKLEYRYMDADSGASNIISGQVSFAF